MNIVRSSQFANPMTPKGARESSYHIHNGSDSPRIPQSSILQFVEPFRWNLPGATAATAANYGTVLIVQRACAVIGVQICYEDDSTSGTFNVEKLTGTTAPNSGIELLVTDLDLSNTPNTIYTGVMVQTSTSGVRDVTLAVGDRLAIKDGGTLTGQLGLTITILLQYP